MPYEVEEPTIELHEESKFYFGDLNSIEEDDGNFGPQLRWNIHLDDDEPFVDDDGTERPRETWTWTGRKITTHENNKFRKYAKALSGREPVVGEVFDERHYTKAFYKAHPEEDPKALTGFETPWRVAVMFQHTTKKDGSPTERVDMLIPEHKVR